MSIGLVSVPLTLNYLGNERYGLWMLAASILTFLAVIEATFVPTLKNRLAECFAVQDEDQFNRYASASLHTSVLLAVSMLAMAPIITAVPWATLFKLTEPSAVKELTPLMLVLLAIGAASIGTSFIEAVYAARMSISITLLGNVAVSLIGFALLLFAIHMRASLPLLAAITGIPVSLVRVLLFCRLLKQRPAMFSAHPRIALQTLRTVFPSLVGFGTLQLTNILLSSTPNILTARYLGVSEVTTLTVIQRLASVPLMIVAGVAPVFWPSFTIARARGDHNGLKRQFLRVVVVTVSALLAYSSVLVIAGPVIVRWWLGGRVSATRDILMVIAAWLICQGAWYWLSTFLNSMGDVSIQNVWNCVQFAILIACGIPLAARFGLLGLVLAMAWATFAAAVAPLTQRVRERIRTSEREWRTVNSPALIPDVSSAR